MNSSAFTVSEEMVAAKEQANARRRDELLHRQTYLPRGTEPEPNFPPECCCIEPIIYHNIREQVPVAQQRFMYILCGLYLALIGLILVNIAVSLLNFLFSGSALHFGLSFLYLLGLPGAWILWYYNTYMAVTACSRPLQVLSLFGLLSGVLFDVWMAIGVPGFGGCGWIITITSIGSPSVFIPLLIVAVMWTMHGVLLFGLFCRYWKVSSSLLKGGAAVYRHAVV